MLLINDDNKIKKIQKMVEKVDLDVLASTCPFINFTITNIVSPLIMLGMGMIGVAI